MGQKERSPYYLAAIKVIKKIPKGKVATYGQIARLAGRPQAVRAVAWFLHSSSKKEKLPWHRVVNAKGEISLSLDQGYFTQKQLLEKEGVHFSLYDKIDLKKYQWSK